MTDETQTYYLRVAATNFSAFLADTEHLPTIRGGSMLLRNAIRWVDEEFEELERISQGASEGLFAVRGTRRSVTEWPRKIREALRGAKEGGEALRHATFSVSIVGRKEGDFVRNKEQLIAAGRWEQMRAPSLAVPSPVEEGARVCEFDRLRPSRPGRDLRETTEDGKEIYKPQSESVHFRREAGRDAKREFYRRETGDDTAIEFSQTLEQLATDPARGSLNGKMAVVYVDGNSFSRLIGATVQGQEDLREIDETLGEHRKEFLRTLVQRMAAAPALCEGPTTSDSTNGREAPTVRLELLLWGGDDMAWVVPGWAGLWSLAVFYGLAEERWKIKGEYVKHAAGLVLCHHKAPIHRMREIAEALADIAKEAGRERSLVAYEVLESFDDVGDDLDADRERRGPDGLGSEALVLHGPSLATAIRAYGGLRGELPMRRIRAAVDAARGESERETRELRAATAKARDALEGESRDRLGSLLSTLAGDSLDPEPGPDQTTGSRSGANERAVLRATRLAWHHLGALGDYLRPVEGAPLTPVADRPPEDPRANDPQAQEAGALETEAQETASKDGEMKGSEMKGGAS